MIWWFSAHRPKKDKEKKGKQDIPRESQRGWLTAGPTMKRGEELFKAQLCIGS